MSSSIHPEIGTDAAVVEEPITTAVLANRFDSVVREMTQALMRSARSPVIAVARDFSCTIVTRNNELLAMAEGIAVHSFGSHLQCASMARLHPELQDGDAFLDNDPYLGNTHPADHTILMPVIIDGEHLFTVTAKAHQADAGNSVPSTYHARARDVYEEGALIFPCVQIASAEGVNEDVVRMCRARIRVGEQWYADMLAMLGCARLGVAKVKDICVRYGTEAVRRFVSRWLDYSERRMSAYISTLPAGRLRYSGAHDPLPRQLPHGVPVSVEVIIDPEAGILEIDLRDNIDCVDAGLNQSEACSVSNSLSGLFNCIDPDMPKNAGSFRRVLVHLRDGCVVGRPAFPHSCSVATTNIAGRLGNFVQACLSQLGDGFGLAEGGGGNGAGRAVISGVDRRAGGRPYIGQLWISMNGGPASPQADGWVNYNNPISAGVMYRDSVELDELKYPIRFSHVQLISGWFGAGRTRGAPGYDVMYSPTNDPMKVVIACDAQQFPPRGVHGGADGMRSATYLVDASGQERQLENFTDIVVQPGQSLRGVDNGGAGYGDPCDRDPSRVLSDVLELWETPARARELYGVVLKADGEGRLCVDTGATDHLRASMATRE